jgi:predicted nucleic acid-binding protein
MSRIFADACYWIALLSRRDELHDAAVAAKTKIGSASLVTTDEVLAEVLNFFCSSQLRSAAGQAVQGVRADARVTVEPQTRQSFDEALELYQNRADKTFSHTDCRSFALMRRESIAEALTDDKHFVQEGFVAILAPRQR